MQQRAWLAGHAKDETESRNDIMEQHPGNPDKGIPDMGPLHHIISWLIELGEVTSTSEGLTPLSWQEIDAWSRLTGINLSPRESLALRQLSVAYIHEFYRSNNRDCVMPTISEPDRQKRVNGRLKKAFEAMRK